VSGQNTRDAFHHEPSVLLWKIATPYRIADGSGTYLFHHTVELALDLVQATEDQGETVGGGHDTHWMKEAPATTSDRGLSWQSGLNSVTQRREVRSQTTFLGTHSPSPFRKEVVLASFATEAQAPMVVADKTKPCTTVCTAIILQFSHDALPSARRRIPLRRLASAPSALHSAVVGKGACSLLLTHHLQALSRSDPVLGFVGLRQRFAHRSHGWADRPV
jgi:hypothetical protein